MSARKDYELIKEISDLVGLSCIELLVLTHNLKPAVADLVNFDNFDRAYIKKLDRVNQLCKELSLNLAVSECKFIVNSPRGIFEIVKMDDERKGKISLGIAKDIKTALEGVNLYYKKTLNNKDSRKFGEVMGYPKCCLDFGDYLCNPDDNPDNLGFKNPAVESLKRSKDFSWQLNVFSYPLLSYYPCTLACQPSVSYINSIFEIYQIVHPKLVKWMESLLKEPTTLYWTCADKILFYGDFKGNFKNSEIRYNRTVSEITSGEFYQKNDTNFLDNLENINKEIQKGNRLVMTPKYFEIYKDRKRIKKIKKDNQYVPVLVKPNK